MDIGIGLPNSLTTTRGRLIPDWARRAEVRGFSSLATIDRIAYASHDSLVSLSLAAAVTERIGLMTDILLGPTRDPVLLAKEAATLDQASGGRLTLGLAVGSRKDDYDAVGRSFEDRGRRFQEDLETLHRAWRGEPVGGSARPVAPPPADGERVRVLIGGMAEVAAERVARWADGWTAGGAPPEAVVPVIERVREAWTDAGRPGEPRLVALSYYSLGEGTEEASMESLRDYYAYTGDYVEQIARAIPRSPEAVRERVAAFGDAGVDELVLFPTVADLGQVDLLADVVLEAR